MLEKKGMKKNIRLAVCTVALSVTTTFSAQAAEYVSIAKDGINLRSGPDTTYEILFQLPQGYPLKVLSRKGEWLKVSDYEDDKGWVYQSLVNTNDYVIVKVKESNVRSGPGTNHAKVGSVARDVILRKVGSQGEWIQVEHPQLKGWLHGNLVWP